MEDGAAATIEMNNRQKSQPYTPQLMSMHTPTSFVPNNAGHAPLTKSCLT